MSSRASSIRPPGTTIKATAQQPADSPPSTQASRSWASRARGIAEDVWETFKDYVVRVYERALDDNIFLLASGLTFNVFVAALPFLVIVVATISLALQAVAETAGVEPIEQLRRYLDIVIPVLSREVGANPVQDLPEGIIRWVVARGQAIGLIGFALFVWFSTRLFGSVRTILREVFDLRQSRGVLQGKIFDAEMVVVASVLVILNVSITVIFNLVKALGIGVLGLSSEQVGLFETAYAEVTALAFIFLLFLLIYKYVPARRAPWGTAMIAAAFAAVCWEALKLAFSFYLTRIADYRSIYGGIATLIVVVVWGYYSSILFVLGAEVAKVHELRLARSRQHELLD